MNGARKPGEQQVLELPIAGMTCAACSTRLEKHLNRLPGVTAAVNLAAEKARVEYDPAQCDAEAVLAQVAKTGFSVPAQTLDLQLTGMTCASCAAGIEKALNGLPGVEAHVVIDPDEHASLYNVQSATPALLTEANLAAGGTAVTAVASLIGRNTLIVGDSHGDVHTWFSTRDGGRHSLVSPRTFRGDGSAVKGIAGSPRDRLFLVGYESGRVRVFQATSGKRVSDTMLDPPAPVDALAFSPKTDGLLVAAGAAVRHFSLETGHPEVTLRSLFRPVWYEGYARPPHVWQSSAGTDDFEVILHVSRYIGRTLRAGDELVLTRMDHDANVAPWLLLAEDLGLTVRWWDVDTERFELDLAALEPLLNSRTRLVAVTYASNAIGSVTNVRGVVERAHAVGARVFVDAVQYAPHALIDVQGLGCDFLACSAYKFYGPHQGVLWGRRELLEAMTAYKVRPASDELRTSTRPAPRGTRAWRERSEARLPSALGRGPAACGAAASPRGRGPRERRGARTRRVRSLVAARRHPRAPPRCRGGRRARGVGQGRGMAGDPLGLIAGNGRCPFLAAQGARRAGRRVVALAIREETAPELEREVDELHWISLGELGRGIDLLQRAGAREAVMAGQVKHRRIFSGMVPDLKLLGVLARLAFQNTDSLIGAVAEALAREGITLLPSVAFLAEQLAMPGSCWVRVWLV